MNRKLGMLEAELAAKQQELSALPSDDEPAPMYDRDFAKRVLGAYLAYLQEVFANPYGINGAHPLAESVREIIDTIMISQGGDGKRRIAITGDIHDVILASGWQEDEDVAVTRGNKKPSALDNESCVGGCGGQI